MPVATVDRRMNTATSRIAASELSLYVPTTGNEATLAVAGRVTVDSSPKLRSTLLELLRRVSSPVFVIDFSAVSYVDMSGIATLLEALKSAHRRSVKLRLVGIGGQSRTLAEIGQIDAIFRAWGSEVEFR